MRQVRGDDIAMIFQEPMTSLNPVLTCGFQIAEAVVLHQQVPMQQARIRAIEMLQLVGFQRLSSGSMNIRTSYRVGCASG